MWMSMSLSNFTRIITDYSRGTFYLRSKIGRMTAGTFISRRKAQFFPTQIFQRCDVVCCPQLQAIPQSSHNNSKPAKINIWIEGFTHIVTKMGEILHSAFFAEVARADLRARSTDSSASSLRKLQGSFDREASLSSHYLQNMTGKIGTAKAIWTFSPQNTARR